MATRAILRERAAELESEGLTPHRRFRKLRTEFPGAERDSLVDAAGLDGKRKHANPTWTETGGFLLTPTKTKGKPPNVNPVPPKTRTLKRRSLMTLTATVPAHELREGDLILGEGIVSHIGTHSRTMLIVVIDGMPNIIEPDRVMTVVLEDDGR